MGILDVFRGNDSIINEAQGRIQELSTELRAEQETNLLLQESLADVELALEDKGWQKLSDSATGEFTRKGLNRASEVCRVMAVANPLIKRGLNVRQSYVFGGGVEISGRDEDINTLVVQPFTKDESNKASLTGSQAEEELERALGTDGNVFLACFTTPRIGRVEVRSLPFREITDIITNPEDRDEPWYYERRWSEVSIASSGNGSGHTQITEKVAYYPDIRYRPGPSKRLNRINGHPVMWNAPIYHISVNRLDGWKFGIGDAFAAVHWARGYKEFLEDWATLVKALSRFAWRTHGKNRSTAQKMRERLARRPASDALGNPSDVGGTAVMDSESTIEAIPKSGAVIDSSSGKPLAAMVASALEISLVVLLTDPGMTGARAVAETLDEPTIHMAEKRRELWREAYQTIVNYVIDSAVRAGRIKGTEVFDKDIRRVVTRLPDDSVRTIDVSWPELGSESVKEKVESVVNADSTRKMPPAVTAELLLKALGVDNVDELVKKMTDDNGDWKDPEASATAAAVRAFRQGRDPASALMGEEGNG